MTEFAGRYPDPHLRLLVDAATNDTQENRLPPGLEESTQQAADRLERGDLGLEAAFDSVLKGLSEASAAELALTTLANICLTGRQFPNFKKELAQFSNEIADALKVALAPQNWRLCGRAAVLLSNLVCLGEGFAEPAQKQCLEPLIAMLQEEKGEGALGNLAAQASAAGLGDKFLDPERPAKLWAAFVNLLVVRPDAIRHALGLGALEVAIDSVRGEFEHSSGQREVVMRACVVAVKLLTPSPDALTVEMEHKLLGRLSGVFQRHLPVTDDTDVGLLDVARRLLTLVLTRRLGALTRLAEVAHGGPVLPLGALLTMLSAAVRALKPREYATPDDQASEASLLRGNLALLFGHLCEAQEAENAPAALTAIDLTPVVGVFVECLRRERGPTQRNAGVCVTRFAQSLRYRKAVRDVNGFETLHQVQLPKVEAEKAQAQKLHRIQGP
jgi:hypothetical protein